MVLAVRRTDDDRSVYLALRESEVAQRVEGEQLETITIVAAAGERLFERGPMVDCTILAIVELGFGLNPGRDFAREASLSLRRDYSSLNNGNIGK